MLARGGVLGRPLDGSGYLVDPAEGGAVAACSWLSAKWPHLQGPGTWMRAICTDPAALAAPDAELRSRAATEVNEAMSARAEPDIVRMARWDPALPVFTPGHRELIARALDALPPGVAIAGAHLGAVGIPDCVASGEEAARRLVAVLARA